MHSRPFGAGTDFISSRPRSPTHARQVSGPSPWHEAVGAWLRIVTYTTRCSRTQGIGLATAAFRQRLGVVVLCEFPAI
jgi:hypothetical protein